MRREPVIAAVAGQERDPPPGDLADHDRIARRAKRGVDRDLIAPFEQCVEPRAADDPDGGFVRHGAQATFVPVAEDLPELAEPVFLSGFVSPGRRA